MSPGSCGDGYQRDKEHDRVSPGGHQQIARDLGGLFSKRLFDMDHFLKSLLNLLHCCFFFFFFNIFGFFGLKACGILAA